VRRALAAAAIAIALASAAVGAAKLWPDLSGARARDAGLSKAQAARAIWRESPLPPALYDFWRSRLRRGDRYYVAARQESEQSLEKPNIVRAYAAYWLLPAIQVRHPRRANVVLTFRVDPGRFRRPRAQCLRRLDACVLR
jgi:hypothetical protein